MFQFFVDPAQINDTSVIIGGADYNHIKNVLRMKPGEEVNVYNGVDGKEYRCQIDSFGEEEVFLTVRFIKEENHELPSRIYLFQGLPKGDKMESIIQKNVELGVYEIVPVEMKRCVVKLDGKKAKSKTERWQEIARAAAKQSKRGIIPNVTLPMSYKNAVDYAVENCDVCLLPYEMAEDMSATREVIESITPGQSIAIFIGSEGGFEADEVELALSKGFKSITLGKRILRTETAGMTVSSILMYRLEDM